ncbi:hypothetical protein AHF37_03489 [Paragonimus kellicotti]|nr:hypothetical protein AHF37_03489 [Paragonimus kellicotti]
MLVLKHEFGASHGFDEVSTKPVDDLTEWSARLTCRRCGRRWDSEVECQNTNQHGCVQQKAAFLSGFLAPRELVKQGLPFICLFCCTEPTEKGIGKRIGTGVGCQKARPVKLYESAMRFRSKLHLVVHILCRHAVRRKNGMCAECPFVTTNFPNEEGPVERAFWMCSAEPSDLNLTQARQRTKPKWSLPNVQEDEPYSSSESEPETVSPNHHADYSILKREGLLHLEKHIDTEHLPNFELLTWYMSHSMPTRLAGGSAGARKAAMYSCPICDLNNYRLLPHLTALAGEDLFKYASDVQGKYCYISSNAMLQAHVACYHSGAKELDSLLEMCQVCETTDFMRISTNSFSERSTQRVQGSLKHLVRAGHVHRLQRQFDRCVNQGRLDSESIHVDLNWSTVCVFCWRRFAIHLGSSSGNLLAQCRLQTHLIVQHCAQSYEALPRSRRETVWGGIRPCGWCGDTMHVHTELEKGIGKRIGTGVGCQKARPVKLYESAMRFRSKLHLVVHILCRHAVRRKNGMCAECPFVTTNFPNEEGPVERAFWMCSAEPSDLNLTQARQRTKPKWSLPNVQEDEPYSSSESEPETVSPNHHADYSILKREGLLHLEKHIDTEHLPNFELLTLAGGSAGARKAAMYSCPICDLNNYRLLPHLTALAGEDLFKYASDVQGKYCYISSNAMLQAHVACYHSGAKELDSLLEMCQVCETTDFMRISTNSFSERSTQRVQGSLKHLVRAGHVHRLQRQFDRCVNQGRLDSESIHVDLNWSTVCVFCWRRFAIHLGSSSGNLLAQCRLQTHLIVQHCAQSYEALTVSYSVRLDPITCAGFGLALPINRVNGVQSPSYTTRSSPHVYNRMKFFRLIPSASTSTNL